MRPPRWICAPAVVALAILAVPLLALLSDVPWTAIPSLLSTADAVSALRLSLLTSTFATLIIVLLGIPLALILSRAGRFAGVLRVLVVIPMTMPPVVGGLALLSAFGRRSAIGTLVPAVGEFFAFSTPAVVMAQVFVGLPFLVLSAESALKSLDIRYVEAARGLGAGPSRILFRIILPIIAPAIFSGTALAMARTLGEFGATLTFAGSLPGVTRTMPLAIYLERESQPEVALALAALLLGLATALVAVAGFAPALLTVARKWRRQARPASGSVTAPTARPQRIQLGERDITIDGWTAVIGPNGAGKTTLLRRLAGLDGKPLLVDAILLTQYPALFPHMTVLDNVLFACRNRARAWHELDLVGASELADRFPHEISGGQAARVALARALAASPQVLLLDEPLAAVDPASADKLRDVLGERLAGIPVVHVTHDPVDVAVLADSALVIEAGDITAYGSATALLAQPSTKYLADFAGLCSIAGTAVSSSSISFDGGSIVGEALQPLQPGMTAVALFSPRAVTLASGTNDVSSRNQFACTVTSVGHHGSYVRIGLATGAETLVADITPQSAATLKLRRGDDIIAQIKALQVSLLPR